MTLFLDVFAGSVDVALIHAFIGCVRAVVKSPKPFVERNKTESVIALEIFVMKIVVPVVGRDRCVLAQDDSVKARMPDTGGQRSVNALEYDVERVGRNDEINEYARIEQELLHRMHCQAGPRTWIDIIMMQLVNPAIQYWNMEETMDKVEMKSSSPNWREQQ